MPSGSTALNYKCLDETKASDGKNAPMALTPEGNVKCMSIDGKNCLWDISCNRGLNTPVANIKPLVCGQAHKTIYGNTGYDNKNHWCYKALQKLQTDIPKVELTTSYQCLDSGKAKDGKNVPMALTNLGDPACMSIDGVNCLWDISCNSRLSTPINTIKPLVCGQAHENIYGETGYTNTNHWCSRVRETFRAMAKPTITKLISGNKQIEVQFINGLEGSAITNYEYSIDGGLTFKAITPAKITSPIAINGLINETAYTVVLRAISNMGTSVPSNALAAIPKDTNMPTVTDVLVDSKKNITQESSTNILEASNLVKDLKELLSSAKRIMYMKQSSEAKQPSVLGGISTTTGDGVLKGIDTITSIPAPTATYPILAHTKPNTACLQQGSEMNMSSCPDMSQYIRKDQIPCYNCNLGY